MEILADYLEEVSGIIIATGGTVVDFIGDAVVVRIFGLDYVRHDWMLPIYAFTRLFLNAHTYTLAPYPSNQSNNANIPSV